MYVRVNLIRHLLCNHNVVNVINNANVMSHLIKMCGHEDVLQRCLELNPDLFLQSNDIYMKVVGYMNFNKECKAELLKETQSYTFVAKNDTILSEQVQKTFKKLHLF